MWGGLLQIGRGLKILSQDSKRVIISYLRWFFKGFRHDLLFCIFALIATLALIPIFTYIYFVGDLSSKEKLFNNHDVGIVLLDRNNRVFFTFYEGKLRKEISLEEIPKVVQMAVIAMEDKDFYVNPGFSFKAIARAFFKNLVSKNLSYGASTITQQLVKNSILTPKKDFLRKYQEIVLAQEIGRRYSKSEILEMYLNSVYFGEGAFGIQAAAKTYFNKNAKDLNLPEAALLIGLLPAPSSYSPISNGLEKAKYRQELVLQRMVEQKYITLSQAETATREQVHLSSAGDEVNTIGAHFALMVKDQLVEKYGEETLLRSGFKVHTSLDLEWQKYAEKVVADQVKRLEKNRVSNGAAVVIDPRNGEIRALVGSVDWQDNNFGKVNIITSLRPPGSSFKPIVYLTALERGVITPATMLKDVPTTFTNVDQSVLAAYPSKQAAMKALANNPNAFYKPLDYDRQFRGLVTTRRALANSLNIPAVEVMSKVSIDSALNMAKRLGLTTLKDSSSYGLSLVLGTAEVKPLELTNVYATFANKGYKNDPTAILKVVDKTGETIYKYQPKNERIVSEQDVFLVSSILSDNNTRAEEFGNTLTISRPAAVKTGTTEDYKDAWTIGYTPSLTVGSWVGNNLNEPMDRVAGSLGAAPIWKALMEEFLKESPVIKFEPPSGVIALKICKSNGFYVPKNIATSSGVMTEYFKQGTQPTRSCFSAPTQLVSN